VTEVDNQVDTTALTPIATRIKGFTRKGLADRGAEEASLWFPVQYGLITEAHCKKLGGALWLVLWCVKRTTKEVTDENGIRIGMVLGGRPLTDADIADELGLKPRQVRAMRQKAEKLGYLGVQRVSNGQILWVMNSRKFFDKKKETNAPKPKPEPESRNASELPKNVSHSEAEAPNSASDRHPEACDRQKFVGASTEIGSCIKKREGKRKEDKKEQSTKDRLFDLYGKKFGGNRPNWTPKDSETLKVLEALHQSDVVVRAYDLYTDGCELQDGSHGWAEKARFPFGWFGKHFDEIAKLIADRAREEMEADFDSDCLPEHFDPKTYCEFEVSETASLRIGEPGKRKIGLRETAERYKERGWVSQIFEPSARKIWPAEIVQVLHYGDKRWISKKKAQKYLNANYVTEVL
jgi:hypothetical protein